MLLGFSKTYKGQPTNFPAKILAGTKIHTLRADEMDRWQRGRSIQMATGVRTKQYEQFHQTVCTGWQKVEINGHGAFSVQIDGFLLSPQQLIELAINDGFNSVDEFIEWFTPDILKCWRRHRKPLIRKLIHWTDFRYQGYRVAPYDDLAIDVQGANSAGYYLPRILI